MFSIDNTADPSDKDNTDLRFVQEFELEHYQKGNFTSEIGSWYSSA
jgi:hypothetical protein